MDLSRESLVAVETLAAARGFSARVETLCCNLDALGSSLRGRQFDRIVGSYSLYYSSDAEMLFAAIDSVLACGGRLFFCGPAHDNNLELRRLIAEAIGKEGAVAEKSRPSRFMEDWGPSICRRLFEHVEVERFENPVVFTQAADLIAYWRSHNLFDPSTVDAVEDRMREWFAANISFVNMKRGIGVLAVKQGG